MRRSGGIPWKRLFRQGRVASSEIFITPQARVFSVSVSSMEGIATSQLSHSLNCALAVSATSTSLARTYTGVPMIYGALAEDDGT